MLGADERGVRRTCGYAAATSEEGNDADGKNHKPAKRRIFFPPKDNMALYIAIVAAVLLIGVVAFVLHNHWNERHGDNHF